MGLTLKDDWKCLLSMVGGPFARTNSTTEMQLPHVSIWDSGTFVCVKRETITMTRQGTIISVR